MSLLFRIVYAAHAKGTHHKLALDGLAALGRPDAAAWERLFLKHAALFLQGAKAPDDEFKDFKNHVLHPRDGYWGGAPEKVASWYGHLVAALRAADWTEAVWCAGVLSHYLTDPLHPFHTAQSEAENSIHRAVEWSINRDYDALRAEALARADTREAIVMPAGDHALKDLVCFGAERANRDYEKLIAHYDFTRGVVEPREGLDNVGRRVIGSLMLRASDTYAAVLARALDEAGVAPPDVSLTLETLVAALQVPFKWFEKRLADAADRRAVEAIYDELKRTGRVEATLPEDDRAIRDLHAREVLEPRAAAEARARAARLPADPEAEAARRRRALVADAKPATPPAPAKGGRPLAEVLKEHDDAKARFAATLPVADASPAPAASVPSIGKARPLPLAASKPKAPRAPDIHLAATDDLEAAPTIGPRMAERFASFGIRTVGDFLAADPETTAVQYGQRGVGAAEIALWQDQARLVMSVPGLRGTHAQLLAGAGYRTVAAVAAADADKLCADLLNFATTSDGHRILRDGNPPDVERIKTWIDGARQAMAA